MLHVWENVNIKWSATLSFIMEAYLRVLPRWGHAYSLEGETDRPCELSPHATNLSKIVSLFLDYNSNFDAN